MPSQIIVSVLLETQSTEMLIQNWDWMWMVTIQMLHIDHWFGSTRICSIEQWIVIFYCAISVYLSVDSWVHPLLITKVKFHWSNLAITMTNLCWTNWVWTLYIGFTLVRNPNVKKYLRFYSWLVFYPFCSYRKYLNNEKEGTKQEKRKKTFDLWNMDPPLYR